MGMKNFYAPPPHPGAWENFWLPLLLGIGLFLFDDYLIPNVFALPLLLLVALIFLAFRLPAWMVTIWTVMYAGVILTILLLPVREAVTDPEFKPYVRTGIFLAGGSAAILLASHRQRLEKGHEALFSVISALPVPIIVSDISGNILLLNASAQGVLKCHLSEMSGLSYFSTFVGPEHQGQAIATYIDYFKSNHGNPTSLTLRTRSEPPLSLHAEVTVVKIAGSQYAVTMVQKIEA
jgi:PAS domain-containing protein